MPEHLLLRLKNNIKPQWKTAFFAAIIIGFLTHLYIFTNTLPNHDSLFNIYGSQKKFALGRFFLSPFSGISSYFDLPWVNGTLSIFYLALTAVALVELFDLRKNLSIVLTAGLLVTFPTVTSTFSYMFTADAYMLGSLTTVLALILTKKYKYGFLPGALLFYLSVGVYQANLPFLLTLVTVFLIAEILGRKADLKTVGVHILRFFAVTAVGMALYGITFKLYTNFFAGKISDYQGLSEVGDSSVTLAERFTLINDSFQKFFFRGFITDMPVNLFEVLNVVTFVLIILGFSWFAIYHKLYRHGALFGIAIGLLLSLPLSAYCLYFVSAEVSYHMLMVMALISIYFLPIVFYDNYVHVKFTTPFLAWSTVLVSAVLIFNFAIIANIAYFNMNLKYERSYAFLNRVVDRIEETEGASEITTLAIFGRISMDPSVSSEEVPNSVPAMTGMLGSRFLAHPAHYKRMMKNYFGYSYDLATTEEKTAIEASNLYKEMEPWPAASSVRRIDDTIIIKLDD
ncbi:glucosyltransferase domain-containing protein [Planococcus sp. CP5-4]|uniref:glucosyltransferase domain-containing protein n=1 Tax=unclassified Planococcus (in: firmicutes) TaxID=2662419 RepID=UPI001C225192|nr:MULTISPECIES: glucosyltransferase domain-containing protein [unclassified Planococcus (in: firmicutes)]MBU9673913.1 glucosyltransferase domain-containing protein [Planococcus sp. CP5-4_YE]MBV0909783.1 glucosyltransferase domain-containing protein [Planococcus sp. CP5-4_UN]MBW6065267.1 glucosyltransferase domain-containing protein [Planococcus sp. CP5-4]